MKDYVLRAQKKYIKNNYEAFAIRLNKNTESEVINLLKEKAKNKELKPYIYNLIAEDMKKRGLL